MPHTRESALWARAGGAAAHLQSKMRSIASSFQSSGMLIGDEEAASHWALSRLLGALTCPASMPTCTHLSQYLLGRFPLRAPPPPQFRQVISGCGVIGHQPASRALRDQ